MKQLSKTVDDFFRLPVDNRQPQKDTYTRTIELIHHLCHVVSSYERQGYDKEAIAELLTPLRLKHACSPLIGRLQQWPKGYPGDYESIEYMLGGRNQAACNTLEYFIEEYALNAPITQQHRNKLRHQAALILDVLSAEPEREKKVLSIACNSAWALRSIKHLIADARATFYLNDHDVDALAYASRELAHISSKCRFMPGNFVRAMKTLTAEAPFDLITTGGVCDYLSDRQMIYLIRNAYQDLLASKGTLYLTNVATGNPYRPWMEYMANWTLIERDEADLRMLAQSAGFPPESVTIRTEDSGLTLLVEIRKTT